MNRLAKAKFLSKSIDQCHLIKDDLGKKVNNLDITFDISLGGAFELSTSVGMIHSNPAGPDMSLLGCLVEFVAQ